MEDSQINLMKRVIELLEIADKAIEANNKSILMALEIIRGHELRINQLEGLILKKL